MSGGLYLLCLVTVEKSVREKGAGVTTLYQRLGILVPILCSALLWGEVPSTVQLAGLAASVAVMAALWGGGGRAAAKGPLAVFLLGGAVEFTGKVFQKCALAEYRPVFLFVLFAACAVLALPRLVRAPKLPPAGVALGAAMGTPAAAISLRATGCSGSRTATVSSPALTLAGTRSERGKIIVSGPGQNASASFSACGGTSFAMDKSSSNLHI